MSTLEPEPMQHSWETSKAARRIMAAAVDVFSEQGYSGTSTRDIARRLDLSPAAMYPHFDSKEELLYAVAVDGHRRALATVRGAADQPSATQSARLAATVSAFVNWQVDNRALARVVQYEIRSLNPNHYREVIELRHDTSSVIEAILAAGRASAEFTCPNASDVTLAITSLCVDICRWFPSGQHKDAPSLAASYAGFAVAMATAA